MNEHEIREFANRDWAKQTELDRSFWVSEYRLKGFAVTLEASRILQQHMKSVRPEWPDAQERQRDLEHHIAFKQSLDKITHGLSSR